MTDSPQNPFPAEFALLALDPSTLSSVITAMFTSKTMGVKLDLPSLVQTLNKQVAQMQGGDKSQVEALLFSQVITMNAIFAELARRAAINMGQHLDATEAYMRLALKAQNQCRATLETLCAIKNPPVVIAKQANINNGQVNNVLVDARAGDSQNQPNQVSGEEIELRQNTGAPRPARSTNQALEAVGTLNRPQDTRG